jgi:hypothetical protein
VNILGWFRIPGDFPGLNLLGSFGQPPVIVNDGLVSGLLRHPVIFRSPAIFSCLNDVFVNGERMSTSRHADWRADLDASRDLSDLEKQSYGFVLGWFESWRLRKGLRAERPAAVLFWKEQVLAKPRKDWQRERWAEAGV